MLAYKQLKNGETIAYREQGSGDEVVVMLHGNMTSSVHLDIFREKIDPKFRVITPDMRGFGESSYHREINSLRDFADDMIELINLLGVERFTIGGWSTGGGVAMEIAATIPERIDKLILIEAVGITGYPIFKKDQQGAPILTERLTTKDELREDFVQVIPVLNAYANRDKETLKAIWNSLIYVHDKPDDVKYDIYLEDMMTQRNLVDVDYALMYFNMSHEHNGIVDGSGRIDNITAYSLIVQGRDDLVVPPSMGLAIKEALGEKAELFMGEWGHSPFIDIADELMEKINEFI